ncbi:hypothetical protein PN498_08370 [Oscillatoria sp. CS-180]|uniref:hypothetical protein n=1 Tax=Oscillatoria sp. CS-180 TaxID=3021720 RepID=UPI00232C3427|nr:hypothetical protein [Oscillatoria sp. CS-180]MDB9525997.1 hypothetical protein [Oscillatoria sp. CS-180]
MTNEQWKRYWKLRGWLLDMLASLPPSTLEQLICSFDIPQVLIQKYKQEPDEQIPPMLRAVYLVYLFKAYGLKLIDVKEILEANTKTSFPKLAELIELDKLNKGRELRCEQESGSIDLALGPFEGTNVSKILRNASGKSNHSVLSKRNKIRQKHEIKAERFINRNEEQDRFHEVINSRGSICFYGEIKSGKTALWKHLHAEILSQSPLEYNSKPLHKMEPLLYPSLKSVGDLSAKIFESCALKLYDQADSSGKTVPFNYKNPSHRDILKKLSALIFIDDCNLEEDEFSKLTELLEKCSLVLTSSRRLFRYDPENEGFNKRLKGLGIDYALSLFKKVTTQLINEDSVEIEELDLVSEDEIQEFCGLLEYYPGQIVSIIESCVKFKYKLSKAVQKLRTLSSENRYEKLLGDISNRASDKQKKALGFLALFNGLPVRADHLAQLVSDDNIIDELSGLTRSHIIEFDGVSFRLSNNLAKTFQENWIGNNSLRESLNYFIEWTYLYQDSPEALLEEADLILHLFSLAKEASLWQEALLLGRFVEASMPLNGWWDAWGNLLNAMLNASEQLGDISGQAFVRHELGTHALCMERFGDARDYFETALQLREGLPGQLGIDVTRHNLQQVELALNGNAAADDTDNEPPENGDSNDSPTSPETNDNGSVPPAPRPSSSPSPWLAVTIGGIIAIPGVLLLIDSMNQQPPDPPPIPELPSDAEIVDYLVGGEEWSYEDLQNCGQAKTAFF